MKIPFYKYQGAGNDFILIDNRNQDVLLNQEQINRLCDRRFGIGADGLMFLEQDDAFDFRMRYYNSDGREGTMCGNGGRCIVAFANQLGIQREQYVFSAIDGVHKAVLENETVDLKMNPVKQFTLMGDEWFLDTGSPHVVKLVEDVEGLDVNELGSKLRYDTRFGTGGSNVNFINIASGVVKIRTYERGVEAETLACGTGSVASAIIAHQYYQNQNHFVIEALGGTLEVRFKLENDVYTDIWLKGEAKFVFKGTITC